MTLEPKPSTPYQPNATDISEATSVIGSNDETEATEKRWEY